MDFCWLRNWCLCLGSCGEKNGAGDGEGNFVDPTVGRFGVLNVCMVFGSTVCWFTGVLFLMICGLCGLLRVKSPLSPKSS